MKKILRKIFPRRIRWKFYEFIACSIPFSQLLTIFSEFNYRKNKYNVFYSAFSPLLAGRLTKSYDAEKIFCEYIENNLSSNDVFLDIGACIGTFSLFAAKKCKSVYAIEANPMNVSILIKNIKLNKFYNILPIQCFLNEEELCKKESSLKINVEGRFGKAEISNLKEDNKKVRPVDLIISQFSWDKILEKNELSSPTFVKIDVDGFELNVIRSISLKEWEKINHLLIEINDENVIGEINKLGFKYKASNGDNFIFTK